MHDIKTLLISRIFDIKSLTVYSSRKAFFNPQTNRSNNVFKQNNTTDYTHRKEIQQLFRLQSPSISIKLKNQQQNYPLSNSQNTYNFSLRKKQKIRTIKQMELLSSFNSLTFRNSKQIEQFYYLSIDIFTAYDQQFQKFKHKFSMVSVSMQENLKKVYSFFFLKHDNKLDCQRSIPETLKTQIYNLSPSFFLGWIRKWSIKLLQDKLINSQKMDIVKGSNNIFSNPLCHRQHYNDNQSSQNLIRGNKFFDQSSTSPSNKINQQLSINKFQLSFQKIISSFVFNSPSNQNSQPLMLNSKEVIYSYIVQQLKIYYKNLPIEDLDINYIRTIKRAGRKEDLLTTENLKSTVQTLSEIKNSQVITSIRIYQEDYKKGIQSNQIIKHLIISPKLVQSHQRTIKISMQTVASKSQQKEQLSKRFQQFQKLSSNLLKSSLEDHQYYKNKIKYSTDLKKQQCEKQDKLQQIQNSHRYLNHSVPLNNCSKINAQLDSRNRNVLKNLASIQSAEIQRKIRILQRINAQDNYIQKQKLTTQLFKGKSFNQREKMKYCFIDEHIQSKNLSKLPKLNFRDSQKNQDFLNPQKFYSQQSQSLKKQQKNKRSFVIFDNNNSSHSQVSQIKRIYSQKEQNKTKQLSVLLSKSKIHLENQYNKVSAQNHINKRFLSQTADKDSSLKRPIGEQLRPKSNFSFKSKVFVGGKKTTFNVIKFAKNKISIKNELSDCQNISSVQIQIKDRNILKNNIDKGVKTPTIFSSQKIDIQGQSTKEDFIKYLKRLEREKITNQKQRISKQKIQKNSKQKLSHQKQQRKSSKQKFIS